MSIKAPDYRKTYLILMHLPVLERRLFREIPAGDATIHQAPKSQGDTVYEVWKVAIAGPNLPLTVLLGLVLLYWLGVILGALDMDMFNMDVDADMDVDVDLDLDVDADLAVDADADADMDAGAGGGAFSSFAIFLNLDKIPLTVVFSSLITLWWAQAILLFQFFFRENPVLAWPVHLGTFFTSIIMTKILTQPLVLMVKALGGDVDSGLRKALGQVGVLDFDCDEDQVSQAVVTTDGAPLIVNVKSRQGAIAQGSKVVLVELNREGDFYYVSKLK